MRHRQLFLTTAAVALLAAGQSFAQQQAPAGGLGQGGIGGQGQAGAAAGQQQGQGGLPGQRLAQEQAQSQGAQIYISPAGTRQIQQALNQKGYAVGAVDGQWSNQSQQAVRNFQQANGLEPTGTLTARTIAALGLTNLLSGRSQVAQGQAQGGLPGQRLGQERASGQGTPLHISPAGVRQIEQALNQRGYSAGNIDGQWDQQSRQAAVNFQQAQGLEPTGVVDVGLINALGIGRQVFGAGLTQGAGPGQGGLPGQRLAQEESVGPGAPLYFGPAGVRQLTQALNQLGYAAGPVDGNWDQQTRAAVRNFQQAQGLEPTGTLTTNTLAALGMSNWARGGSAGAIAGRAGSTGLGTGAATGGASGAGAGIGSNQPQLGTGQSGTGSSGFVTTQPRQ